MPYEAEHLGEKLHSFLQVQVHKLISDCQQSLVFHDGFSHTKVPQCGL